VELDREGLVEVEYEEEGVEDMEVDGEMELERLDTLDVVGEPLTTPLRLG